jgi:hypothetical protein
VVDTAELLVAFEREIGWQTGITKSLCRQIFQFTYDGSPLLLDINVNSNTVVPAIQLFVNSKFQEINKYRVTTTDTTTTITLLTAYVPGDVIEVSVLSDQTSPTAYYQVPINLENNPLNGNSAEFTLGTVRNHYSTIAQNLIGLSGSVIGPNNTRDLGNIVPYGLQILQQSSPLTLAGYFLRSEKFNIFASLQYNMQEYLKFKGQLLNAVTQQTIQYQTTADVLDTALEDITLGRISSQAFYWSDMLPSGSLYSTLTYEITNTSTNTFDIGSVYNYTTANYQGMNVYLNNVILTRVHDYVVATDGPRITVLVTLAVNDVLTINEYSATYGSFVPNTPTKLVISSQTLFFWTQ